MQGPWGSLWIPWLLKLIHMEGPWIDTSFFFFSIFLIRKFFKELGQQIWPVHSTCFSSSDCTSAVSIASQHCYSFTLAGSDNHLYVNNVMAVGNLVPQRSGLCFGQKEAIICYLTSNRWCCWVLLPGSSNIIWASQTCLLICINKPKY